MTATEHLASMRLIRAQHPDVQPSPTRNRKARRLPEVARTTVAISALQWRKRTWREARHTGLKSGLRLLVRTFLIKAKVKLSFKAKKHLSCPKFVGFFFFSLVAARSSRANMTM